MPHPRLALLLPLVLLAACETPRQACLADAGRQLSVIDGLIAETQGNLARGFALDQDQVVRNVPDLCEVEDARGRVRHTFCERTQIRDVTRPVAIDPRAERAKLDGLLESRATLAATQAARAQACLALPDA